MRRIERARRALLRTFVESRPAQPEADDRHEPTRRRIGARRRREGQSLVEFAVTLPVFLLLIAGIVDFGLGLYSQMTIINAAREGARLGVVEFSAAEPGEISTVKGHVEDLVESRVDGLNLGNLDVDVDCLPVTCDSGDAVIVNVNYDYHMIWPLAFGNTIGLSSTVQMRIE